MPTITAMPVASSFVPFAAAWMTPAMIASTTSPSTSSITAAPRMIREDEVRDAFASCSTRAVMPTEVAASIAPTNAWAIQELPGLKQLVDPVAEHHRRENADHRDYGRRHADRHHVARGRLEAHLEEEEDCPQLGEDREGLARLEPGHAGSPEEGEVAEQGPEQQLAEDGGLAEPLDERAEELRADEDEGEGEEDEGVLSVTRCRGSEGDAGRRSWFPGV